MQYRLEQQTLNRVALVFLAVLGGWLVLRSLWATPGGASRLVFPDVVRSIADILA